MKTVIAFLAVLSLVSPAYAGPAEKKAQTAAYKEARDNWKDAGAPRGERPRGTDF